MIGKTIAHYQIIEQLGRGGMGVVYKARDLNLDRFVALKFLAPHLTTNDDEKQRFIHEAKAASILQHQNICTIHEIGETEDDQLFICMDYYEGKTLQVKIKDEKLKIKEAAEYTLQIARGLARAHEEGIVHRDIKPANIVITNRGEIRILDFGLAKLATQTRLTKDGSTLGTIAYMSPEQASGEQVDHRTDLWSLGVILYEMLTGRLPFKGEFDQAVIYSILNEGPELPGTEVPEDLRQIIFHCLEKDASERYQNVSELIGDLEAFLPGSDAKPTPQRKRNPMRRILSAAIVLSAIIILSIARFLIFNDGQTEESGWENSIAVLPFDNISNDPEQEYFCDGMTEQIISNLSRLARLKVLSRTSVMNFKDTQKSIPEIGKELNVAYVLEGSIRKFGNRIRVTAQLISTDNDFHLWSQDYDKEYQDLFDVQDNVSALIATSLLDKLSGKETLSIKSNRPDNIEAYEYFLKAQYLHYVESVKSFNREGKDAAKSLLNTSEEMLKKSIKLDPKFADSYAALANIYNSYYNFFSDTDEERDNYRQLSETYLDTALKVNPNSAEAYYVMHYLHSAKGEEFLKTEEYNKFEHELDEAFNCLKSAIEINPNHEKTYIALAYFFRGRGLDNLSIKCLNKSIELDPLQLNSYSVRGAENFRIGEFKKAERDFQKVLEIAPDATNTLFRYSQFLIAMKRYEEAEEILREIKRRYPDSNTDWEHALIYASKGEKEKALDKYKDNSAALYSLLGMKDEAISTGAEWGERQFLQKSSMYFILKNHPFYINIRSDPRFQEILAKHKELLQENLKKYGDIDI